jgi:hypothetical protein
MSPRDFVTGEERADPFGDAARERTGIAGRPPGAAPAPEHAHAEPVESTTATVRRMLGDQSKAGGIGTGPGAIKPPARPSGSLRGALR